MKTRLALNAEIDVLNKGEMEDALSRHNAWEREAAFGLRHQDLPKQIGVISGGNLAIGADQPDQQPCGPKSGWYWGVKRVSVDGLAAGDAVKLYTGSKFVCWITDQPGYVTFGKGCLVLRGGDFLRITGTGLTAAGPVEVYGETDSVPGPLSWKILS